MKEENRKKIIKFFSKDLSKEEKKEFIEKAGSDKEFIKEFVRMAELNEVIEDAYGVIEDNRSSRKSRIIKMLIIGVPAAAIFLLGIITGIQRYQFNTNPGQSLFDSYYQAYDVTLTRSGEFTRSSTNSIDLLQLYTLYVKEEYETLLQIDLEYVSTEEVKESAHIMQGISAIEVENYQLARKLFELVNSTSRYYSTAKWYLLLLSIQDNEFDNVIPELSDFSEENLIFRDKALGLIEILEKKKLVD